MDLESARTKNGDDRAADAPRPPVYVRRKSALAGPELDAFVAERKATRKNVVWAFLAGVGIDLVAFQTSNVLGGRSVGWEEIIADLSLWPIIALIAHIPFMLFEALRPRRSRKKGRLVGYAISLALILGVNGFCWALLARS
jgi:hypothetical protein